MVQLANVDLFIFELGGGALKPLTNSEYKGISFPTPNYAIVGSFSKDIKCSGLSQFGAP